MPVQGVVAEVFLMTEKFKKELTERL